MAWRWVGDTSAPSPSGWRVLLGRKRIADFRRRGVGAGGEDDLPFPESGPRPAEVWLWAAVPWEGVHRPGLRRG